MSPQFSSCTGASQTSGNETQGRRRVVGPAKQVTHTEFVVKRGSDGQDDQDCRAVE
jgi:hypothetical protein